MTARDFCFWLQGALEAGNVTQMDEAQTECVRKHLALVFIHEIDPSMGDANKQAKLNDVHTPAQPHQVAPRPTIGGMHPTNPNILLRC